MEFSYDQGSQVTIITKETFGKPQFTLTLLIDKYGTVVAGSVFKSDGMSYVSIFFARERSLQNPYVLTH